MFELKVSLIAILLLAVGHASACNPHTITWDCNELPHVTAKFSGVSTYFLALVRFCESTSPGAT